VLHGSAAAAWGREEEDDELFFSEEQSSMPVFVSCALNAMETVTD